MAFEQGVPAIAAAEAIRAGNPRLALEALTVAVKAQPADPRLRIFLSQLFCVLGQWERAHTQLNVMAELDQTTTSMREMVGHALRCEKIRSAVFAGRRAPMVFGQPEEWLATLIESTLRMGRSEAELGLSLAARAFEAAPATQGLIDGEPFEWLSDGDSRLGPVLEALVNGRYYWIPFARLARIAFEPPTDLRDLVWLPCQLQFANGGEAIAMIPTRYPGSETSDDNRILMARMTIWREDGVDRWLGLGQRVLCSDRGEYDLLGIRSIEFRGHDV